MDREHIQLATVLEETAPLLTVAGDGVYGEVPPLLPYGVYSLPPAGEQVWLLSGNQHHRELCLGTRWKEETTIEPGEVLLSSLGGATLHLKNDGTVWVNGQQLGGTT